MIDGLSGSLQFFRIKRAHGEQRLEVARAHVSVPVETCFAGFALLRSNLCDETNKSIKFIEILRN